MSNADTPTRHLAIPLLLSVVLPGLGQLAQKRWLAAAVYGLCELAAFGWFSAKVRPVLDVYLQVLSDPEHAQASSSLDPVAILIPAAVAIVIYIVNIWDVVRGSHPSALKPEGGE